MHKHKLVNPNVSKAALKSRKEVAKVECRKVKSRPWVHKPESVYALLQENGFINGFSENSLVIAMLQQAQHLKEEGDRHLEKTDFEKARACYTAALEIQQHPDLYTARASSYLKLSNYALAHVDAQLALKYNHNKQACVILLQTSLILCDITSGESVLKALKTHHRYSSFEPHETQLVTLKALTNQLKSFQQDKDYRSILVFCGQARKIAHGNTYLKLINAEAFVKLNRCFEAVVIYREILTGDRTCAEAHLMLAICKYLQNSLDEATQQLEYSKEICVDTVAVTTWLSRFRQLRQLQTEGLELLQRKSYAQAKTRFFEVLHIIEVLEYKSMSLEANIAFNLSVIERRLSNIPLAFKWINRSIELIPDFLEAIVHRAGLNMTIGKYEEAMADYTAAKALDIDNPSYQQLIDEARRRGVEAYLVQEQRSIHQGYYQILGIEPTATLYQIKTAYKKKALMHHPDKHQKASTEMKSFHEAKFKSVAKAYEVLSNLFTTREPM